MQFAKESRPMALEQIREGFHLNGLLLLKTEDDDHVRIKKPRIRVSDELDPAVTYVDFPGVRSVAEVQLGAIYKRDGRESEPETPDVLTSLRLEQVIPEPLLALNCEYWATH